MSKYENIDLNIGEHSATLTIKRPPMNVLNIATMREMSEAFNDLKGEKEIRSVVITGAGNKAFSAGVDVADHTEELFKSMLESFDGMLKSIVASDKITVAAINGIALGGGLEVILACDLALAVETAVLGQPEIKLGVFAGYANAVLPRLIAHKKAMEIVVLGETLTAPEAQAMGLINWAVPIDQFNARVEDLVKRLGAMSAAALKWCKRSVYTGLESAPSEAVAVVEKIYVNDLMATNDAHEGIAAFTEKRRAVWKNA